MKASIGISAVIWLTLGLVWVALTGCTYTDVRYGNTGLVSGGTVGRLEIGAAFTGDTLDATNTTVRQHTGTILLVSGQQVGTDNQPSEPATGYSWLPLLPLADNEVGPNA